MISYKNTHLSVLALGLLAAILLGVMPASGAPLGSLSSQRAAHARARETDSLVALARHRHRAHRRHRHHHRRRHRHGYRGYLPYVPFVAFGFGHHRLHGHGFGHGGHHGHH